ncbi:MAG: hypothetical protein HQL06_01560 [Nitrospirae bacterium]|nr:hypothetical protein [Nitrospirota bacterium]
MKIKVLITVKTYPNISPKYEEVVCTAGVREDGSWIRIYPIPFRKMDYDKRFKKYQWIELNLERRTEDFRPESYRPLNIGEISLLEKIDTANYWQKRREIILKNEYYSLDKLIKNAKDKKIKKSLAVFKPREIIDFIYEEVEREWDKDKVEELEAQTLLL